MNLYRRDGPSVARHTKAKADHLATVAEGIGKKLSVQHAQLLQQVYTAETEDAIKARTASMQAESLDLKRAIREATEKLEQYQSARGMQGMVKEYAEILSETERVKAEILRLQSSQQ